jgi:glutamate carboxypeptidase
MIKENVFDFIEAQSDKYTKFLFDICSFEATAYEKEEIDKMIDFIKTFAENEGMKTEITHFKECGNFLTIDINKENSEKGAYFLAHTDTVHKKGAFGTPAVRIYDDKLIGPGAVDCKGGIAVALLTMKALMENGYKKHARLVLTSDEEISNRLGKEKEFAFFDTTVKGFPYAINCEVTEGNEVIISRKGILKYEILIKGKGGHSGIHYFECVNPILEAANKIVALESLSNKEVATYSCNIINAGTAENVIPESCTFTVDIRYNRLKDLENIKNSFFSIVNKSFLEGTTATITKENTRLPMEKRDETLKLFDKLNKLSIENNFGELTAIESGGGSDSAYTQNAGVLSICGMGPSGYLYHTNKEYVEIPTIKKRAKLISALLINDN